MGLNFMTPLTTLLSAVTATGASSPIDCSGASYVGFQVTGTMTSLTLTFQATIDGTNWVSLKVTPVDTQTASATTTAAGVFVVHVAGLKQVRVNVTTYASGNCTVVACETTAP